MHIQKTGKALRVFPRQETETPVVEKPEVRRMKDAFEVRLIVPEGVTFDSMRRFIEDALKEKVASLPKDDPISATIPDLIRAEKLYARTKTVTAGRDR